MKSSFYARLESEIKNYLSGTIELTPGVKFSQYQLISRIYRFKNRDLGASKINEDLSYNYFFDIISPRADSEVKNIRFDSKDILVFSQNPKRDFAAVFLANSSLRKWMAQSGEDLKLKAAVEEYVTNGNVGFKRVKNGYDKVDVLNCFIFNTHAETTNDTDIAERYDMTASQIMNMEVWDKNVCREVIKTLGNKSFKTSEMTSTANSTSKHYEIFEFTGQMSEKEFNEINGKEGGDENVFFLAKVIIAGLRDNGTGEKFTLFSERLDGQTMDQYYLFAHRGRYDGRFWRIGMYEMLFDHQIRANQIGNDLAKGLEWASKVVFRSKDTRIMQNIRADIENGDIITTDDLQQVDVRLHNLDQLIADWNRLMSDADRLANSGEIVRGESVPSATPFRMGVLLDENAGKMFILLKQKITLVYKEVFKGWILPEMIRSMKGKDVFQFTGDTSLLDQLREVAVESWYADNLVQIGPHTREQGEAIKQEKLDEMRRVDPAVKNAKEIWNGVLSRLMVTITGENSGIQDQVQDLMALVQLETDPDRRNWILDTLYAIRGIPVPPRKEEQLPDPATAQEGEVVSANGQQNAGAPKPNTPEAASPTAVRPDQAALMG